MTVLAQRWIAAAIVLGAITYLAWRGWRSWRPASRGRRSSGCDAGCGCS